MGCFFACFSASKSKKHQHLVDGTSFNDQVSFFFTFQKHEANEAVQSSKEEDFGIPFNPIIVKKEKLGELLNDCGKKKVTFDLNVKNHEEFPVESADKLLKNNEDKEREETKETAKSSVFDLTTSNVVCKSQNNRYQNSCAESEDELEDLDLEVSDLDDDNEEGKAENESQLVMEESSESLFSLSIESRKQVCEVESDEKEVTSPTPIDKSPTEEVKPIGLNPNSKYRGVEHLESVLNPVENLAQWKEVKAKASIPLKPDQEKENINLELEFDKMVTSPEPSFKLETFSSKFWSNDKMLVSHEIAVDTSLSSWLVEPENTLNSKASSNSAGNSASNKTNSSRSHDDRPILGALTKEELKKHYASTSPRKCRSQSPDETPIIGTVGSYWSHTGQTIDSDSSSPSKGKSRTRSRNIQAYQEERLKWNAIPFEVRLERALDGGIAGV
ncbi:uncharacterized protein LOC111277543 [Durio zibethinus]|uniref:Uncharacterized protein LOC111277543 n=1 Tax=Durio zibethinus TaxID=66656 RepID=A0A6P5WVL7_DURZI|nr:uncharacterized protein LOC111277543 [Durio zibethinus]